LKRTLYKQHRPSGWTSVHELTRDHHSVSEGDFYAEENAVFFHKEVTLGRTEAAGFDTQEVKDSQIPDVNLSESTNEHSCI